jgi:hypothetical protein
LHCAPASHDIPAESDRIISERSRNARREKIHILAGLRVEQHLYRQMYVPSTIPSDIPFLNQGISINSHRPINTSHATGSHKLMRDRVIRNDDKMSMSQPRVQDERNMSRGIGDNRSRQSNADPMIRNNIPRSEDKECENSSVCYFPLEREIGDRVCRSKGASPNHVINCDPNYSRATRNDI